MAWKHAAILAGTLLSAAVSAQQVDEPVRYDGHQVVRVELQTLRDLRTATALSDDPWTCRWDASSPLPAVVDFRMTPDAVDALRASGLPFEVLIDDVQALIDAEAAVQNRPAARDASWYGAYRTRAAIADRLQSLVAARPDIAGRFVAGVSLEGREIFGVRIGRPAAAGAPPKPAIVINAAQHAREWASVMSATFLIEHLITAYDADPAVRRLVESFDFHIIPITNPDGFEYSWVRDRLWRKNRRPNGDGTFGVDLNRNWNHVWGGIGSSGQTSSETYRGTGPFSEPESTAVSGYIATIPNPVLHVDLHTYGQYILEPWGHTAAPPPDASAFELLSTSVQRAMHAAEGRVYTAGAAGRVLYATSGTADSWTYGARDVLATCIELRDQGQYGFLLPADQILPTAREFTAGIVGGGTWLLDNPLGLRFVDGQPAQVPADAPTDLRVQVTRALKRPAPGPLPGQPVLHTRRGRSGPFTVTPLTLRGADESGPILAGTLNAGPCGTVLQYYLTATASDGSSLAFPPAGPAAPFEAASVAQQTVWSDDFETDRGWTSTGSSSQAGAPWLLGDPIGSLAQPEFDRTPLAGAGCYVIAGLTTSYTSLVSPVFSLAGAQNPRVSCWIWFCTSRFAPSGRMEMLIEASATGLAASPAWTTVYRIAADAPPPATAGRWVRHEFDLPTSLHLTDQMRLRFVTVPFFDPGAADAAIDDVRIVSRPCLTVACRADWNGDGAPNVADIFAFLRAWFAGEAAADIDAQNGVQVTDIFAFLREWFSGCR